MIKRTLAVLWALAILAGAVPAVAQSINLPAGTVYGRLGIGTGLGQAIPFGSLATQLGAAADPSSAFAKSIDDYGASPTNSGAANLTAIQAGIDATPAGGTLYVKRAGYNVAGTLIINHNMKLLCTATDPTVAANLTQITTSANLLAIRSGYATVQGCSLSLAGAPSGTATGIIVGDDAVSKTSGGSFTNASTTLTCSTCTFTPADVGKSVYASSVGASGAPLFTRIAAFVNTTQVTLADAAGGTQATQTFGYGFNYQENVIVDTAVYNFVTAINVVAATQYHIRHSYMLGADPLVLQNILWSDQGDGSVTENTIIGSVAGSHNSVLVTSGGGLRFMNNKVLAQAAISTCIAVSWAGVSSVGPWMIGNSIEGPCSSGIAVNGTAAAVAHGGIISANEIGIASAGTSINLNPTTAHPSWTIGDNLVRTVGGGSAILLTNMTKFNASNNTGQNIDGNGSGVLYNIGSTSSGNVSVGSTDITNPIQNASANVLIDDPQGLAFASLPTVAANGSRIFVTNGASNTSPCTGSSTGAQAVRQNGAWSCGVGALPAFSATKGGTDQTGIASATFTALTWPTVVYNINGNFASNAWTPPAGKVSLFASFNATGTITSGAQCAIAIFKNGAALRQNLNASPTNDASASVYVEDAANGTDVYTVQAFITTSAGTATVQGATNVTYFGGHWISP